MTTSAAQRATTGRPKGSRNKPKAPKPAGLTPPAQYDRMRAPIWTHSPSAPVRDGAEDHKCIASRGYRC
ncbi:hypothetical protein [Paracidovorax cattleyae]|uniref:hypothetical protein n=1 Tax=Paracidovorax cattleyae TaxID=80868 RepID=UPI0018B0110B|nr:hypothetical protein [Paracidovorax cattleyae]MBF9263591.1 hypothetical protein [Paracidovorax cattleyae]